MAKRRRKTNLGSPRDFHLNKFLKGIRTASAAMAKMQQKADARDCRGVMKELQIAEGNISYAYAHLESMERPSESAEARFQQLRRDVMDAHNSLGFQCTRSLKRR